MRHERREGGDAGRGGRVCYRGGRGVGTAIGDVLCLSSRAVRTAVASVASEGLQTLQRFVGGRQEGDSGLGVTGMGYLGVGEQSPWKPFQGGWTEHTGGTTTGDNGGRRDTTPTAGWRRAEDGPSSKSLRGEARLRLKLWVFARLWPVMCKMCLAASSMLHYIRCQVNRDLKYVHTVYEDAGKYLDT